MSANTIGNSDTSAFVRFKRTDESKSISHKQKLEPDEENQNNEDKYEPFQNTLIKRKKAFAQIKEMFSGLGKRKILPCYIK